MFSKKIPEVGSVAEAEALAFRWAIQTASDLCIQHILFQTDCLRVL